MLLKIVVFVLICGLNNHVFGAPTPTEINAAIDGLRAPVDILWEKGAGNRAAWQDHVTTIINLFTTIYDGIDALPVGGETPDFRQVIDHTTPDAETTLLDIIFKLLYAQSDRVMGDFLIQGGGGPHIRMYAFGIIGKICEKLGTPQNRKTYLYPYLKMTPIGPRAAFYSPLDNVPVTGLEEHLDYYKADLEGPFTEATEIIEAQLYNFYQQWTPQDRFSRIVAVSKVNTMNAALQNMLVVIDYIMELDDTKTAFKPPGQGTDRASYIYDFANNRVSEILEELADRTEAPEATGRKALVDYGKFLLYTYFIPDSPEPVAAPTIRLHTAAYDLLARAKFTVIKSSATP